LSAVKSLNQQNYITLLADFYEWVHGPKIVNSGSMPRR
jgi:hypothetical protein